MAIRTKLTIWYTSVLALVLVAFGAGVYTVLTLAMVRQLESNLQQSAETVWPVFRATGVRVAGQDDNNPLVVPRPAQDPFRAAEVFVEILDRNTKVVGISSNLFQEESPRYSPLDPQGLTRLRALSETLQTESFSTVRLSGLPSLYVLTRALRDPQGGLMGYLQVASSLESIETAQRILLVSLIALGTGGLIISAVLGAFLARRALRPVDRITQTALAIYRAENLDQRVPEPKTEDEVGRLSAAFNEMLDRLSRLFSAQQRLVADVSHEMRTPLTVIRGNVDLLNAMGCADPESLDALKRESDRMTRMVGDLLLLSQADAGQLSMQMSATLLAPVISDVERSGRVLAGERVSVNAVSDQDICVMADADRLKQVLLNLTDNAIKHTPNGGQVRIEATGIFNGFARISVSDTGVGIPEADLVHVFERFYRVDKSRSRERGGSGLGLSIAQKIVEAHKGRITVSSKVGEGTTFDVYIPIVGEVSAMPEPARNHGAPHPSRRVVSGAGR
jgi:two-component system, OmpR family, sensor kinase